HGGLRPRPHGSSPPGTPRTNAPPGGATTPPPAAPPAAAPWPHPTPAWRGRSRPPQPTEQTPPTHAVPRTPRPAHQPRPRAPQPTPAPQTPRSQPPRARAPRWSGQRARAATGRPHCPLSRIERMYYNARFVRHCQPPHPSHARTPSSAPDRRRRDADRSPYPREDRASGREGLLEPGPLREELLARLRP